MEIFAGVIIGLAAFCGLFGAAIVIASGINNKGEAEREERENTEAAFGTLLEPCDRAPDDLRLYCPYRRKRCDGCEFNLNGGEDDDRT